MQLLTTTSGVLCHWIRNIKSQWYIAFCDVIVVIHLVASFSSSCERRIELRDCIIITCKVRMTSETLLLPMSLSTTLKFLRHCLQQLKFTTMNCFYSFPCSRSPTVGVGCSRHRILGWSCKNVEFATLQHYIKQEKTFLSVRDSLSLPYVILVCKLDFRPSLFAPLAQGLGGKKWRLPVPYSGACKLQPPRDARLYSKAGPVNKRQLFKAK
jgi:hypothetical protein